MVTSICRISASSVRPSASAGHPPLSSRQTLSGIYISDPRRMLLRSRRCDSSPKTVTFSNDRLFIRVPPVSAKEPGARRALLPCHVIKLHLSASAAFGGSASRKQSCRHAGTQQQNRGKYRRFIAGMGGTPAALRGFHGGGAVRTRDGRIIRRAG